MKKISFDQINKVINLSLPMAGSRLLQMLGGFFGTMMAAHLGKTVLAACALIGATMSTIWLIFISIVFSLSMVVGQAYGAKKYAEIGAIVQQGILLSLLLSMPLLFLFWFSSDIVQLFHQSAIMVHYVKIYSHAAMWGATSIMLQACMQQFCYGVLKQKLVIWINFFLLIIIVFLSYIFIFGKWGFPSFGIAGLAYAFAIQSTIGFLLIIIICFFSNDFKQYQLFKKHTHKNLLHLKQIFQIGWPMSVQFGGELLAFFVLTMMIGWLGVNALAATQITQQWLLLIIVPIFAMSEAGGILVGHAVGAKQCYALNSIGNSSILFSTSIIFLLGIFFSIFPNFFAQFYIDIHNPSNFIILKLTHGLFILLAITLLISAVRDILTGLLRGLFDTQFAMRLGLIIMWFLVVPLGYFIGFTLHFGVIGFRIGGNIGLLVGALIIYYRWAKKVRYTRALALKQDVF